MAAVATAGSSELARVRSHARPDSAFSVEVVTGLGPVEGAWRELEPHALMSPYGRFDWVRAFAADDPALRVACLRDGAGRPAMILPLVMAARFGVRIASGVGGKHVNYTVPVLRRDVAASLSDCEARSLLRRIGREMRADVVSLGNVPVVWEGVTNPFAGAGRPSPSDAWSLPLDPDGEATLTRSMSADARKKLRNKTRALAKLGPVELVQAASAEEIDAILDAFCAQKAERFREQGIFDPFADEALRSAIRRGALDGLAAGRPAIELYGLRLGDTFVAAFGGAGDDRRLSGMFLSFAAGEAAKFSPGEMLVTGVIRLQCERGREVFDLGVGDARYKRSICDTVEPLVDTVVPVTLRGRALGLVRQAATEAKRRIKGSARATALLARTRKALAGWRG